MPIEKICDRQTWSFPQQIGVKKKNFKKIHQLKCLCNNLVNSSKPALFVTTGNLGSQPPKPEPLLASWGRWGVDPWLPAAWPFWPWWTCQSSSAWPSLGLEDPWPRRIRSGRWWLQKSGIHSLTSWGRLVVEIYRYLQGFVDPRWIRISEPSTVLPTQTMHLW